MLPCVLGVDQSATSTGVCVLDKAGTLLYLERIVPSPGLSEGARLVLIHDTLKDIIANYPSMQLAVMEGYSYGSTNKKFVLGEVGGVVKLVMATMDLPLYGASPTQLKKFVTGDSKADKDKISKFIQRKWGVEITQNDKADAYGLAQIGLQISGNATSTDRKELEVINNLINKPLKKIKKRIKLGVFTSAI